MDLFLAAGMVYSCISYSDFISEIIIHAANWFEISKVSKVASAYILTYLQRAVVHKLNI